MTTATPETTTLDEKLQELKILSMNPQELEDFFENASAEETEEEIAKILLVKDEIEKEIKKVSDDLQVLLEQKEDNKNHLNAELQDEVKRSTSQAFKKMEEIDNQKNLLTLSLE